MAATAAALKHLAELAGRREQAEKKVEKGVVKTKTTTKRKPAVKKKTVKKTAD